MHLSTTLVVAFTLAAYFIFSAAVGAMLPPTPEQHVRFYGWLYRFAQRLAANADRLAEARFGAALVPPALSLPSLEAALADPAGDAVVTSVRASATETITYEHQP